MSFKQIAEHVEGALIEVEYAAADASYLLSSSPSASRAADGEAMLFALLTARHLLQEALSVSLRRPSPE